MQELYMPYLMMNMRLRIARMLFWACRLVVRSRIRIRVRVRVKRISDQLFLSRAAAAA